MPDTWRLASAFSVRASAIKHGVNHPLAVIHIKEKHNAEVWDVNVHDDDGVGDGGAGVCAGHDWSGCGHQLGATGSCFCDCIRGRTCCAWAIKSSGGGVRSAGA